MNTTGSVCTSTLPNTAATAPCRAVLVLAIYRGDNLLHAGGHLPWLYTRVHYIHHRYSTPTYWTISTMHPLERIAHTSYIALPTSIIPMHINHCPRHSSEQKTASAAALYTLVAAFFYGLLTRRPIASDTIPSMDAKTDARTLSLEVLDEKRRQAHRLRTRGMARLTGERDRSA